MSIADILTGKEKKIKADPLAGDINAAGKSGLAMINGAGNGFNRFYENANSYVENQIDMENDNYRKASAISQQANSQLVNNRGMGMSSLGLSSEINQQRDLNEKLALNKASGMERLKGVYNEKLQTGQNLFNLKAAQGPIQMTTTKYRTGGLQNLIGPAIQLGFMAYDKFKDKPSPDEGLAASNYTPGKYQNYA